VTLSSTGTASLSISSVKVSGVGFALASTSVPATLTPGQTATVNVTFDPTTAGASTGTMTIASNSSTGATTTVSLTGTGVSYAVNLSWSAPSSSTDAVAGYYVYRAASGSSTYQTLNSSTTTGTTYVDSTAASGQTYQYYVTSVDSSGNESTPSNTATATIP